MKYFWKLNSAVKPASPFFYAAAFAFFYFHLQEVVLHFRSRLPPVHMWPLCQHLFLSNNCDVARKCVNLGALCFARKVAQKQE